MACCSSWRKFAFVPATSLAAIVVFGLYWNTRFSQENGIHRSLSPKELIDLRYQSDHAVIASQERRKTLMAKMCRTYFAAEINGTSGQYPEMFSSDKQRFLYCIVPKAACTSWKRVLSQANGAPKSLDVHGGGIRRYLKFFAGLSPDAKTRVLNEHFKFLFVRHPFERLVSAHQDKFLDTEGNTAPFRKIAKSIRSHNRTDKRPGDGPLTFRELVLDIIDPATPRPFNPHWRPYNEQCQPCRINFDFIGHYETLADDARYVMDRLRIKGAQFPQPSIFHNSSSRVAAMFSQLNDYEIGRLADIYRLDFLLFGYSPDISQFLYRRGGASESEDLF